MSDNPMLPNSFSTPNIYVDEIMYLLTSEEYMVLSYACRRIYGFQKRQDFISLSQFTDGVTSKATKQKLDHGTGLNKMTIQKVIASLRQFGLLIEITPPDRTKNVAAQYKLQEDVKQVDFDGLEVRYNERHKDRNPGKRTAKKQADNEPTSDEGDMNPVLCDSIGHDEPMLSHSTPPMLSHSTPPMLSHSTTIDRGNTEETQDILNVRTPENEKVLTFKRGHNPASDEIANFKRLWDLHYESKPPGVKWVETHVAMYGMKRLAVAMYKAGEKDGLSYIVAIARKLSDEELEEFTDDGYPKPKAQPVGRNTGNGRGSPMVGNGAKTTTGRGQTEFERLRALPVEQQPNGGKYQFNKPQQVTVSTG